MSPLEPVQQEGGRVRGHPGRAVGWAGGLGKRSPLPPASPLAWAGNSGVLAMLFFYHRVNKARNIFVTQKLWVPRVSWDRGGTLGGAPHLGCTR